MGKITGFLEIERHERKYAAVAERVKHFHEFVIPLSEKETRDQAARCMNCGIPYCHGTGSGPAGMACAQQRARAGHDVHVFEKYAKAGGLLRYGIPDFKMEKGIIDRRVDQMEAEGVTFHYGVHVGGADTGAVDPRELLN